MLIREMAKGLRDRGSGDRCLIVFLAPTVHLVTQQFEVIKLQTGLDVQVYYGAKGVDQWIADDWEKEMTDNQVMVMTPQILLDALRKGFLTLRLLHLLIFDECHCSIGNHPYTKIMKEFYHTSLHKPHIFGVSSVMDYEDQLYKLENTLDSKIYTVADRTEINLFVSEVKEVTRYYDAKLSIHEDLIIKLRSVWAKFDGSVAISRESPLCQLRDADDLLKSTRKQSSSFHTNILHCLDDLGLICGNEVVKIYMEDIRIACSTKGHDFSMKNMEHYLYFLEEVSHTIEDSLIHGYEMLLGTERGCLEAVKLGFISSKLYELLNIFQSSVVSNQGLCLIFIDRIITAKVVERFIKKVTYLSHLKVSCLTGGSSSRDILTIKKEKNNLELFHSGNVNLLFTTDVTEEGLHIPNCSCVIRFDLPKTVRSYVQSRGRARQAGSHYFVMLERGNIHQRDLLFGLILGKHSMMDTSSNRDPETILSGMFCEEEVDGYIVESTGATITLDSSISLIHQYCEKLPRDNYFTPKPAYQFTCHDGFYECRLNLPPNAPFQTIMGPLNRNSHVAKQLVCLDACKRLHQLGALSDYLLPCIKEPMEIKLDEIIEKSDSGAGTTKRKELHGTTPVYALFGTWVHQKIGITLQGYKLKFSCDQVDRNYRTFLLLIDAVLDEDIASLDIDLYLVNKMVKASISPCGRIQLDSEQVEQARLFQEFFFNGLFGKLFIGSRSSGVPREYILKEDHNQLWSTHNMYMLLPLEGDEDDVIINWKGIHASASVVKLMRCTKLLGVSGSLGSSDYVLGGSNISNTKCCKPDVINLANKSAQLDSLKDMVVLAIHTGKIYTVLDVVKGSSAENPFEGATDKLSSKFSTYSEYFNKKYGIVLQHPAQPLLLLKHSHNPHNLLSSKFNTEGYSSSKRTRNGDLFVKKPLNLAHMPPELLVHVDISLDVLKSFYLLPSLMHRMESLMLASQLRKEIGFDSGNVCITSSRILEAITTLRCCEDFSLERLELLGDSILKYAVSCSLFIKFPEKHEGQLSSRRSEAVCNAMLHNLGSKHNIQGYIRDAAFDPRRWVAPGQKTLHPVPCNCGIDSTEFPINCIYESEHSSIVIGKSCDKGHRWICSKTISDCVEALIGAYFVDGGLNASFAMMKWLGIDIEFEPALIEEAVRAASIKSYLPNPKLDDIKMLESKLGYEFIVKSLLLEAITHASHEEFGAFYCYQRLEFLGDAALDLLITSYLFRHHKDVDPGELTDLRSASVNNENFAQVAVRHKFQQHLQHGSGLLLEQITEYVKTLEVSHEDPDLFLSNGTSKCPKVLGDIVESIAGAMLIDTKLNLDKLWDVFEPILSPIVTPKTLDLPPLRQLTELCSHSGYFINTNFTMEGDKVVVVLDIQLKDMLLVRRASEKNKKTAKLKAASLLLEDLKKYLSRDQHASSWKCEAKSVDGEFVEDAVDGTMFMDISTPPREKEIAECHSSSNMKTDAPVVLFDKTQKGKPRTALYELCRRLRYAMPSFETKEKPSSQISPTFVSKITMYFPDSTVITLTGEGCPDKKRAQDSASLAMLYELEKQGTCQLKLVCQNSDP